MDDPLRLIQYLYDEEIDDATFARRLVEDEALYREYEQLRRAKERMEERPARRPDPAVVDDVVEKARAAAQESSVSPRLGQDRSARAPDRAWTRRLQTASAALALVLLVGLGWWQGANRSAESAAGPRPETAQRVTPTASQAERTEATAVPAWDDSDELVRIHRRIEQIRAHSGPNSWGTLQPVNRTRP
ncbi:MAG: hypothetical protein ABEK84_01595 [Salinibacter sp.]